MSATTEILLEKIEEIKLEIMSASKFGKSIDELEKHLKKLTSELIVSQNALNESKILKG